MQPQFTPQHAGKVALRNGTIVGAFLGVIFSLLMIVSTIQSSGTPFGLVNPSSILLYLMTPLIWIVGLLIAGIWGSKITGRIGTGTLSGLFAGLVGGIIASFGQAIAQALRLSLSPGYQDPGMLLFTGFAIIFYILILAIGGGAGLGALGGLIGQTISDARPRATPHPLPPVPVYQPPVYQPPDTPYGYMPQSPQQQTPPSRYMEQEIRRPEQ